MSGEPFTQKDAADLLRWFQERNIGPMAAIGLMGGMVCYMLLHLDAADPDELFDKFVDVIRQQLKESKQEESKPTRYWS